MASVKQDMASFTAGDTRKSFYLQNYEWALKMTFRYIGNYEIAAEAVHDTFVRMFRSMEPERWGKAVFIKAAVEAALQGAAQDTIPARARKRQSYLGELAVPDAVGADLSTYRDVIAQLLLLPLYPRLAYNICMIEGYFDKEAAGLLGINEGEVAGQVQVARTLLKNALTAIGLK